jgi:thiol-disulfide isomerase/thioredoxin
MARFTLICLLFVALLIPASAFAEVGPGDKPTYTATTLDGEEVSSAELRGKVVLVDFWATWCAPCKESFPFYSKLAKEYEDDLVVLAVSLDGSRKEARKFMEGKGYAFTVAWHPKHPVVKTFGPSIFPTSYLIDRQGVVRHVHTGFDDETRKQTETEVKALVGE